MTSPDHVHPCWLAEGLHVDDIAVGMPATWWAPKFPSQVTRMELVSPQARWDIRPATITSVRHFDDRPDRVVWGGWLESREEVHGASRTFHAPVLPEAEPMWTQWGDHRSLFPIHQRPCLPLPRGPASGRFALFVGAHVDDIAVVLARCPPVPITAERDEREGP